MRWVWGSIRAAEPPTDPRIARACPHFHRRASFGEVRAPPAELPGDSKAGAMLGARRGRSAGARAGGPARGPAGAGLRPGPRAPPGLGVPGRGGGRPAGGPGRRAPAAARALGEAPFEAPSGAEGSGMQPECVWGRAGAGRQGLRG